MKLIDYIKDNHDGNNSSFARAYDCTRQHVGLMLNHGYYYVYDEHLHIRREKINEENKPP